MKEKKRKKKTNNYKSICMLTLIQYIIKDKKHKGVIEFASIYINMYVCVYMICSYKKEYSSKRSKSKRFECISTRFILQRLKSRKK